MNSIARRVLIFTLHFSLFTLLAVPASRAGFWDSVKKTADDIKKTKEGVEKADRVTTKTKRVVKGIKGFPLEQEIALGDSVAVELTGRNGGVWQDEEATRRVNLVGKALARYCDRQELVWVFGILDSETVNAYSAPGGRVFITRGLYKLVRDDDELAGILAHEITHITRRHALSILRRGEVLAGSIDLAGEADTSAAGINMNDVSSDVSTIMGTLFDHGFEPATEYGADSGAVDLCKLAGYDSGGLRGALEAINARPKDGTWKPSDVFSSHPPTGTRIARLPKRTTAVRPPPALAVKPGAAVNVSVAGEMEPQFVAVDVEPYSDSAPSAVEAIAATEPKPVFPKLPGPRTPAVAATSRHEHATPPGAKFCPTCGKPVAGN